MAIQIADYYSYLETIGFKLVHYWGFLWGNEFFPKVVPGYAADTVFTAKYMHMLEHDLGIILADQTVTNGASIWRRLRLLANTA